MQLRLAAGTTLVAFVALACGSSSSGDDDSAHGAAGMSAMDSTGGTGAAGVSNGSGGTTGAAGRNPTSGGSSSGDGAGGAGQTSSGGANTGGAAGMSAMDSGSGGMPAQGGMAGRGGGGRRNGAGGQMQCVGCAGAPAGSGGHTGGASGSGMGGASTGGSGGAGVNPGGGFAGAIACPGNGQISYVLRKDSNPTADEQNAYDLITTAMDRAVEYYNCYTNITKAETVVYEPSIATADGNINGTIRFGQTEYMEYITAMHEISHTVGIGTDSHWPSLVVNGIFTGQHATDQLRAITGNPTDQLNADTQHFWPYGLNYTSEVHSEADVVDHCLMVVAIRWDEGYDP